MADVCKALGEPGRNTLKNDQTLINNMNGCMDAYCNNGEVMESIRY